jgi:hypothetical protein
METRYNNPARIDTINAMVEALPLDTTNWTPSQIKTAKRFAVEMMFSFGGAVPEKNEFKRFEASLQEWGGVFVVCEIGLVGDEGTMASIFARDSSHGFIGKRGGISAMQDTANGRRVKVRGIHNVKWAEMRSKWNREAAKAKTAAAQEG